MVLWGALKDPEGGGYLEEGPSKLFGLGSGDGCSQCSRGCAMVAFGVGDHTGAEQMSDG